VLQRLGRTSGTTAGERHRTPARRRAVPPPADRHQPRRHHRRSPGTRVAVAGADGVGPRPVVRRPLGRSTAVPGQRAQRRRPRPGMAAARRRRPRPRRPPGGAHRVRRRATGATTASGAALHRAPAARLGRAVRRRHRLDLGLRPRAHRGRAHPASSFAAGCCCGRGGWPPATGR